MSLIPTIYSSDDPGAPQLSGTVGSLISVLRAVLVNGYGTGGSTKASAGWTEEFTGTNKAVFRNDPVVGSGYYVRVIDDGTAAAGGSARSAGLLIYESMDTIDSGVGIAPTPAQLLNGAIWPKSTLASETGRSWSAMATNRYLYLFIDHAEFGAGNATFFGDLESLYPDDNRCFLISTGPSSYAGSSSPDTNLFSFDAPNSSGWDSSISSTDACGVLATNLSGMNQSIFARHQMPGNIKSTGLLFGCSLLSGLAYPMGSSGRFLYEPAVVLEQGLPRAIMPDLVVPLHNAGLSDGMLIEGVDDLPDRAILIRHYRSDPQSNIGLASQEGFVGLMVPAP